MEPLLAELSGIRLVWLDLYGFIFLRKLLDPLAPWFKMSLPPEDPA